MEAESNETDEPRDDAAEKLRSWEHQRTQHDENVGQIDSGEIVDFKWVESSLNEDRLVFIVETPDGEHIEHGFSIPEDKRENNPQLDVFLSQAGANKQTVRESIGAEIPLLYNSTGWSIRLPGQFFYSDVSFTLTRFFRKHSVYRYKATVLWVSLLFVGLCVTSFTGLQTASSAVFLLSALSFLVSLFLPSPTRTGYDS